jgi:hypothetical protein
MSLEKGQFLPSGYLVSTKEAKGLRKPYAENIIRIVV